MPPSASYLNSFAQQLSHWAPAVAGFHHLPSPGVLEVGGLLAAPVHPSIVAAQLIPVMARPSGETAQELYPSVAPVLQAMFLTQCTVGRILPLTSGRPRLGPPPQSWFNRPPWRLIVECLSGGTGSAYIQSACGNLLVLGPYPYQGGGVDITWLRD